MRRYGALFVLLLTVMGSRPQCDARTPADQVPIIIDLIVEPGTCAELFGETADLSDLGVIAFCDTHAGVWVKVERRPTGNTVYVCAAENAPPIAAETIDFSFVNKDGDMWEGTVNLWVQQLLQAVATADPDVIGPGGASQLDVEASGGVPPYSYLWNYTESISGRFDIRNPVARPMVGEVFSVRTTDNAGARVWAQVFVDVKPIVVVSVTPDTIDAGETVSLNAGVSPPVFPGTHLGWGWDPELASGMPVNPELRATEATPIVSTTYYYTVQTSHGTVSADSGHVYVRP